MSKPYIIAIIIFLINHGIIAQTRCDTNSEAIFFITEIMPEPVISMSQVSSVLNTSIDLNEFQVPSNFSIYVKFIINCKGQDFNYQIANPKKIDKELERELISTLKKTMQWTPAMHKGKKVDISKTIKVLIKGKPSASYILHSPISSRYFDGKK